MDPVLHPARGPAGSVGAGQVGGVDSHMQFTMGKHTRVPSNGDYREVAGLVLAVDDWWLRFVNDSAGLQRVEFSTSKHARH